MSRQRLALALVAGGVLLAALEYSDLVRPPHTAAVDARIDQRALFAAVASEVAADIEANDDWTYASQVYDFWQSASRRAFRDLEPDPTIEDLDDQVGGAVAQVLDYEPGDSQSRELDDELRQQVAGVFRKYAAKAGR